MRIILASKSPRRREILKQMGLCFDIVPAVEEEQTGETDPALAVEELSKQKALEVIRKIPDEEALVIGADTVVALDGLILGKPKDQGQARQMLKSLRGRSHSVFTGVTLIRREAGGREDMVVFSERTDVEFYPMEDAEIENYISTGEPMDKAGAYGIQGKAFVYIRGIQGDYYNVVGLPAARIYQEMKKKLWIS